MTSRVDRYYVVVPLNSPMIGLFSNEDEAKAWADRTGVAYKAIEPVMLHQIYTPPAEEESQRE